MVEVGAAVENDDRGSLSDLARVQIGSADGVGPLLQDDVHLEVDTITEVEEPDRLRPPACLAPQLLRMVGLMGG